MLLLLSLTQILARSVQSFPKLWEVISLFMTHPPIIEGKMELQRAEAICPKSIMLEQGLEPRFLTFPANAFANKKAFCFPRQGTNGDRKLVFIEHLLWPGTALSVITRALAHSISPRSPALGPCVIITPFQ